MPKWASRVVCLAIRVVIALLIVAAFPFVFEQVVLEVGHPGLPDEARGDQKIALWLASMIGLILYALFSPWFLGRFLVASVVTVPVVIAGLGFAFFSALGGADARSGAPPPIIAAVLLGTALAALPALVWLRLEWGSRLEVSPRAKTLWAAVGGLLLVAVAAASRAAWEVRRERGEAFERIRRTSSSPVGAGREGDEYNPR